MKILTIVGSLRPDSTTGFALGVASQPPRRPARRSRQSAGAREPAVL